MVPTGRTRTTLAVRRGNATSNGAVLQRVIQAEYACASCGEVAWSADARDAEQAHACAPVGDAARKMAADRARVVRDIAQDLEMLLSVLGQATTVLDVCLGHYRAFAVAC